MSRISPPPATNSSGGAHDPKDPNAAKRPSAQPAGNGAPSGSAGAPARTTAAPAGAAGAKAPSGPSAGPSGGGAKPAGGDGAGGAALSIGELKGRPIGRVLTKMGKVTREQVVEALDFQKRKGGALGRILIDLGYIKEADLSTALAAQRGYEWISLDGAKIDPAAINAVPAQIATTNKV